MTRSPLPKALLCLAIPLISAASTQALSFNDLWINEFHYDNASTDTGEFVEVAAKDSIDLTGLSLTRYDGNTTPESPILGLADASIDTIVDSIRYLVFDFSSLENGPEGFALGIDGALIHFISYESSFTGTGGIADGVTSEDVGVSESSSTPAGHSLQLSGTGSGYSDFSWTGPAAQSRGFANSQQNFVATDYISEDPSPSSVPASGSTAGFLGSACLAILLAKLRFLRRQTSLTH